MAVERSQGPTPRLGDVGPTPRLGDAAPLRSARQSSRNKISGSVPLDSVPSTGAPSGAGLPDPFFSVVRAALRAELAEFAEGARVREAVRSEVDAALRAWSGGPWTTPSEKGALAGRPACWLEKQQRAGSKDDSAGGALQPQPVSPLRRRRGGAGEKPVGAVRSEVGAVRSRSSESVDNTIRGAKKQFESYMKSVKRTPFYDGNDSLHMGSDDGYTAWANWCHKTWVWLLSVNEPERPGRLARLVDSNVFETIVCIVIFLNCAFMVFAADDEMSRDGTESPVVQVGEWAFQIFYTVELALKLIVYRQFFFWRSGCRLNTLDLILVISGFITLLADSYLRTGFWRVLRLLKFGKAIRAIRIMAKLEKLRAFLVCLQGSFASFFWSLVMLVTVYVLFSLVLMQIIVAHIGSTGGDHAVYDGLFGTVLESALTLYMASTGGEDWSIAYRVISETGAMGIFVYLIFIAFVQFALINIITGIFVESAMLTLSPNAEARAMEHARREKAHAEELKSLCLQVDTDFSGKLTREQFEDGLRRKHIPRLLTLLQLQTHHVMEFFDTMAEVADDDGQVEIETFVRGCMQLKGPATNFDLQMFVAEFRAAYAQQEVALELQERTLSELREELCQGAWGVDA